MFLLTLTPIEILAWLVAFLAALTVHEAAHAYMASFLGDPTAQMEGRATLDPRAHIDIAGAIFLILVGFGWGKPVPVNTRNFRFPRLGNIATSVAGPLSNIIFAFLLALPVNFLPDSTPALTFLTTGMYVNIALAVFNFLPITPLDGGHVVAELLPYELRVPFVLYGPYVLFGMIAVDSVFHTRILWSFLGPVIDIVWAAVNLATRFGG